ncbi:MAG TPA: GntR family transcriptional regulator [Conexibacter sp.]|nr:GntR family transcriptional regulator [Conexibacter sp.]
METGEHGFSPLRQPERLSSSTLELLRERLLSGAFSPGQRIVEAELARQLNISRGPVREALAQLKAEGLVHEEPRRGSFMAELTDDDVREVYELRAALETRAAALIIEHRDEEAIAALERVIEGLRAAAADDDREAFARLDTCFHDELCRRSGNTRLHRTFVQNAGLLSTLLRLEVTTQYDSLDGILSEHEALFEEIASNDVARATAACDLHLREATERVLTMRR